MYEEFCNSETSGGLRIPEVPKPLSGACEPEWAGCFYQPRANQRALGCPSGEMSSPNPLTVVAQKDQLSPLGHSNVNKTQRSDPLSSKWFVLCPNRIKADVVSEPFRLPAPSSPPRPLFWIHSHVEILGTSSKNKQSPLGSQLAAEAKITTLSFSFHSLLCSIGTVSICLITSSNRSRALGSGTPRRPRDNAAGSLKAVCTEGSWRALSVVAGGLP
jgi:hypothetical protein